MKATAPDAHQGLFAGRPTITVVIPAFNAAATVAEAIRSASTQSLPAIEVLAVDDGSTDSTRAVLDELLRETPTLRVLRHPGAGNRGVAASRNLGVSHARGEAVLFLDADDILLPGAAGEFAAAFARFPRAGLIYGLAESFGDGKPARLIGRGEPDRAAEMLRQFARFNVAAASGVAVRRAALGAEPFPLSLPFQFEDWVCWLRIARSWPVVFLPRPVCRYRVHPGSFLARLERDRLQAAYEAAQADFLRTELSRGDERERRALREGLAFRAAAAVLQVSSAVRRGRLEDARRWLGAAHRIAGGLPGLAGVLPFAFQERRRIGRGLDPPLSLDPAPEPPQSRVEPG